MEPIQRLFNVDFFKVWTQSRIQDNATQLRKQLIYFMEMRKNKKRTHRIT